MKCYEHQQQDAVGLCKSCHKGLCSECSHLVSGSVACHDCQIDVAALNDMVERGQKSYQNLGKQWGPSVFVNTLCGVLFFGYGLYHYGSSSSWFLIGLGAVMLGGGILSMKQSKNFK